MGRVLVSDQLRRLEPGLEELVFGVLGLQVRLHGLPKVVARVVAGFLAGGGLAQSFLDEGLDDRFWNRASEISSGLVEKLGISVQIQGVIRVFVPASTSVMGGIFSIVIG